MRSNRFSVVICDQASPQHLNKIAIWQLLDEQGLVGICILEDLSFYTTREE